MKPRAYLLIEVAIGGALLAVSLGFAASLLASARAQVTGASHQGVAVGLARGKLDELATQAACGGGFATVAVGAPFTSFTWQATVTTSGVNANSAPVIPAGVVMCDAVVTVKYPVPKGSTPDMTDNVKDGFGRIVAERMWLAQ